MHIGVFSAKRYDRESLTEANARARVSAGGSAHDLVFLETRLTRETAPIGARFAAVCIFVNDRVDAEVLAALRCL